MDSRTFAETVRKRRVELGLTQRQLADKCKMSPALVAKIEQGKSVRVSFETVVKLGKVLRSSTVKTSFIDGLASRGHIFHEQRV